MPLLAFLPLSSISYLAPIGNDRYVSYAKDINDSGVHLLDVINDILDLSKAEAGKLSLRLEEINVQEALRKCEQIVRDRALEAQVSLSTHLPSNLPPLIADRVRFVQIMLNLLSNAIKFTEAGGRVEIHAECEPAGDEVHYFHLPCEGYRHRDA
jgi:signal transduction histidine kinase